jgi:hypothetical protein
MSCNTKLIHIQIIFMHAFLCFDLWTPTAQGRIQGGAHPARAPLKLEKI